MEYSELNIAKSLREMRFSKQIWVTVSVNLQLGMIKIKKSQVKGNQSKSKKNILNTVSGHSISIKCKSLFRPIQAHKCSYNTHTRMPTRTHVQKKYTCTYKYS